jgi:tetratricopeptide (TPR) repeat protein
MQWMTTLALVGSMSLSSLAARGQEAEVPPVPPPAGETTPIPPPPDAPAAPAPAPAPATEAKPETPAQTQPAVEPAPAPSPDVAPVPPPIPLPDVPAPAPSPDAAPMPEQTAPPAEPEIVTPLMPEQMPEEQGAPSIEPEPTTTASTGPATTQAVAEAPPAAPAVAPAVVPVEQYQNPALAERLTSMATGLLRSQPPSNAVWRYAASLLQAATRLAPNEPRYSRFLIEAAGRAGDEETVLRTLESYRKLVPNDEHAQAQLIDLYLARMQSADDRVKYLQAIIDSRQIPPPVRSFAAMRLATAMSERMQDDLAADAIGIALQLNPLNLDALRVRHQSAQQSGQPADRLAAQLALLQASPAQPTIGIGVARELADVGLVQRSIEWFNQALELHRRMGITPAPDVGVDYASQLFISGEAKAAMQVVDQLTTTNPDDLNAWLLKLILVRQSGDKALQEQSLHKATIALTNRIATINKSAGNTTATTRPIDFAGEVPLPDPVADMQLINANNPDLATQYAPVAAGMAWMKIYFEEKPAQAQPFIKAVSDFMGEGYEVVARMQGWSYLVAGNPDDARVKLSAVADKDPIAAMGMVRLAGSDPAALEKAVNDARKLLDQTPSRLTGAFLISELGKHGVKVQPGPGAPAIEKVLAAFPRDWMKIIDQPQQFYSMRVEPVAGRVSVPLGEPVLVQISIHNISSFPLTMGPEGVIHQDLWLDAQTRGVQQQFFPAEAFARLSGPMVLPPKTGITQVVRLDQSQLLGLLERFPAANFHIMALLMTNPTTVGGRVQPGPAGQQVALAKLMERRGAPIGQAEVRQKLGDQLQNGSPEAKIVAAETLTKFATLFNGPGAGDEAKLFGQQASEAVRHVANDPDPTVRAWASYLYSVYTGDQALLTRLAHDPSWIARTLAIVAIDYTGKDQAAFKDLAVNDPEPLVKNLASAALEAKIARNAAAAATQAAPQPGAPQPAAGATTPAAAGASAVDAPVPALTPAVPPTGAPANPTAPAPPAASAPAATQP